MLEFWAAAAKFIQKFSSFFHFQLSKCKTPLQWCLYIFCIIFFTNCLILAVSLVRRKASEQRGSFHSAVCSLRCLSVFLLSKHRRHKNARGQRQSDRGGRRKSFSCTQTNNPSGSLQSFQLWLPADKMFLCGVVQQRLRDSTAERAAGRGLTKHKKHMSRAQQCFSHLQNTVL